MFRKITLATAFTAAILATSLSPASAADKNAKPGAVLENYADIALATYEDSLSTARTLQHSVHMFLAKPTEQSLTAARQAWRAARAPYQQSEAYRFGNPIVDDWEGRVNAWPLDEGLIDYVDSSQYGSESDENALFTANIVASQNLNFGGSKVDVSKITKSLLSEALHEADSVESNVATGYHAIEFLLWGQDLNGTGAGAGNRPATDFNTANCTHGNCERRGEYLSVATDLLIDDLQEMVDNWKADGAARKAVTGGTPTNGLSMMLTGLGSLSYGELAGERMQLGLLLHDPEEEHDCFSDNTHWSHFYDALGVRNVYLGEYRRVDGSVVSGPSLSDLVAARSSGLDREMRQKLDATMASMQAMADRAGSVESYDQMIGENNAAGNKAVQSAIDSLTDQTRTIGRVVAALDLSTIAFEGSDSLDNPSSIDR